MYCLCVASSGLVLLHLAIFGGRGSVVLVLKLLADEGHSSTFQNLALALNLNFRGYVENSKTSLPCNAALVTESEKIVPSLQLRKEVPTLGHFA